MRSTRMITLGLSAAMLCLLANLALATTADDFLGVYRTARQGTITAIHGHKATIQLEDGTTLTMREHYWQKGWQVGNRLQCITEYPSMSVSNTTCEQS